MPLGLPVDVQELAEICRHFHVVRLELFGSRARDCPRPDSDVDLLVTFADEHGPSLLSPTGFVALADALERFFGQRVDLLTRRSVETDGNEFFRRAVLACTETLYAA